MGISLPGGLSEAMGAMGAQFPSTDEDALRADATRWQQLASQAEGWHGDLNAAVSYIQSSNQGPVAEAFASYMHGKSNLTGTQALAAEASKVAANYEQAAVVVTQTKVAIIGIATAVQAALQLAKSNPMISAAAINAYVRSAGAAVRQLDSAAASQIQGA